MMVDVSLSAGSIILLFPLVGILAFLLVFVAPWLFTKISTEFFGGGQMDRRGPGPSSNVQHHIQRWRKQQQQRSRSDHDHDHDHDHGHSHGHSHSHARQDSNRNTGSYGGGWFGSFGRSSNTGYGNYSNGYQGNYGGSGYRNDDYDQYFYNDPRPKYPGFGSDDSDDDDDDD